MRYILSQFMLIQGGVASMSLLQARGETSYITEVQTTDLYVPLICANNKTCGVGRSLLTHVLTSLYKYSYVTLIGTI